MDTAPQVQVPPFLRLAHHPVRWQLLTELAAGDQRVRDLVARTGLGQSLLSYHLGLLRSAGLVTARRSNHDGRDTYYHLDLSRCAEELGKAGSSLHPALGLPAPASTTAQGRPAPDRTPRVLFVCTGNSARSPIAEALLRHRADGRVVVASGGTSPRDTVHPHAVRVLRERFDLDIEGQVPVAVDEVLQIPAGPADQLVTLCDRARERLSTPGWRRTHWSLPDPAATPGPARYSHFVAIATDIDTRVDHLVRTLPRPEVGP